MQKMERARAEPEVPEAPRADLARVGIWEPVGSGSGPREFVRMASARDEWRLWADVPRLPAARRRVVFVGESVARGYLYDPEFSPASVLQHELRAVTGCDGVTVVDLARTDLSAFGLVELLQQVHLLDPEALVVFAGNNWTNMDLRLRARDYAALQRGFRDGGYAALRRAFLDEVLAPRAALVLRTLSAVAGRLGIPALFVIPEFNLLDWECEPGLVPPLTSGGDQVRWLEAMAEARAALANGRSGACLALAREAVELSEGTSAASHRLVALAFLQQGDATAARGALEASRDATCGVLVPQPPRCPAPVQEAVRAAAGGAFEVVDLPALFRRLTPGLPDRRLFLDYCHLSSQGIVLAMQAVAEALVPRLGGGASIPAAGPPEPEAAANRPRIESTAHFMAAVHSAHYGQPLDIVGHHCRESVRLWPDISSLMLAFLEMERRRTPSWMCRSFDMLQRSPIIRRCLAPDVHLADKLANFGLADELAGALDGLGIDARSRSMAIWLEEHGGADRAVDLLDTWHRAASFREREGYSLGLSTSFFRAFTPASRFTLVRAERQQLTLGMTWRLPAAACPGPVRIAFNDHEVAELEGSPEWRSHRVKIAPDIVLVGRNEVRIAWPVVAPDRDEHRAAAMRALDLDRLPNVLQVFGEIDRLTLA